MDNKMWLMSDLLLGQNNCADLLTCWNDVVFPNDIMVLLGNIAIKNKAYWFSEIQKFPGRKILFCGDMETNRYQWYQKFGMEEVIPFNQARVITSPMGKILLSHLPAFQSVQAEQDNSQFMGLMGKFNKEFDASSCVLNIHGHTQGRGLERHNTFDVSYENIKGNIPELEQILNLKFRR